MVGKRCVLIGRSLGLVKNNSKKRKRKRKQTKTKGNLQKIQGSKQANVGHNRTCRPQIEVVEIQLSYFAAAIAGDPLLPADGYSGIPSSATTGSTKAAASARTKAGVESQKHSLVVCGHEGDEDNQKENGNSHGLEKE